jgi:WD40 repeat protein
MNQVAALPMLWRSELNDHIVRLAWSPNGQFLAAADVTGPLALFSTDGKIRIDLPGHRIGTMDLAWQPKVDSATTQRLASCGQDGKIRIWNPQTGAEVAVMDGGAAWVEHLAWGEALASAAGRKIRLWNESGELLMEYTHPRSTVAGLGWQPAAPSPVLAVIGYGGLQLYSTNDLLKDYAWKGSSLALAWSPDGKFIATGDQDSTIHFWFAESGKDLQMYGYPTKVLQLAWNDSSCYLATGGSTSPVIWDCSGPGPEGRKPLMLPPHEELVSVLAYQPGSELLVSGGLEGMVFVWNPRKNKKVPLYTADLAESVSQLAWSPDGKLLAVGTEAGDVVVFRI